MPSPLFILLAERGPLDPLLSESVRFHSPVTDYEGRADVAHLLTLIGTVVTDLRTTREFVDDERWTTFISGTVEERPVQGVVDERYDDSGQLVEVTLMLRPLSRLLAAVGAMAVALESEPLPSLR